MPKFNFPNGCFRAPGPRAVWPNRIRVLQVQTALLLVGRASQRTWTGSAGQVRMGQLVHQGLNRQRSTSLCSIVNQYIGTPVLGDRLPNELNRISSHLGERVDNSVEGADQLDRGFIANPQWRQEANENERGRKGLTELLVLLG